ncbi:MAG: PadR family transcriptional regulator [Thermomicrobiales bacterium]
MRNALLAVLARGPAHGYELKQAIEGVFGGAWPAINIGQIYTTLGRLERDRLVRVCHVAQAHRPDKKVYELTDEGRKELDEWFAAPSAGPRLRDELFTKVILAGLQWLNGGADPAQLIERQRRHFLQALRELGDLAASPESQANPAAALLFEGAMLHIEADLKWLERCETFLAQRVRVG